MEVNAMQPMPFVGKKKKLGVRKGGTEMKNTGTAPFVGKEKKT